MKSIGYHSTIAFFLLLTSGCLFQDVTSMEIGKGFSLTQYKEQLLLDEDTTTTTAETTTTTAETTTTTAETTTGTAETTTGTAETTTSPAEITTTSGEPTITPTGTTTPTPETTTPREEDILKEMENKLEEIDLSLQDLESFVNDVFSSITTTEATEEPDDESESLRLKNTKEEDSDMCDIKVDLCKSLITALDDVQKATQRFVEESKATEEDLEEFERCQRELEDVVNATKNDREFVATNIDQDAFNDRLESVQESVADAKSDVKDRLDGGDSTDNTLAIVLGVLGGVLGVALIVGAGYAFKKNKDKKKNRTEQMKGLDTVPGHDNEGFSHNNVDL